MNNRTAPGVYTQIIDRSFTNPVDTNISVGLIGVAEKGPINVPTRVNTIQDFQRNFGRSLGTGFYLADAVAVLSEQTNNINVVRVGCDYQSVDNTSASGTQGEYRVYTPRAAELDPDNANLEAGQDLYVRVRQIGKKTTVNAPVEAAFPNANPPYITLQEPPTLDSADSFPSLADTYTDADIDISTSSGCLNPAESVLYGYGYTAVSAAGTVTGVKNDYKFYITGSKTSVEVGAVYRITQSGRATTSEIRVKASKDSFDTNNDPVTLIEIEPANVTEVGYQALPLQDSYSAGVLEKVSSQIISLYLQASTPGTWANGAVDTKGLYVKVRPGAAPGSKKLEVYENNALVETFDNLSDSITSDNYYETRIGSIGSENGLSSYIRVRGGTTPFAHPANTVKAWNSNLLSSPGVGQGPKAMPFFNINAGGADGEDGSFDKGANGAAAGDAEFIGTVDYTDDSQTGIKAFLDSDNIQLDVIAAPMDNISVGIQRELDRVAREIKAIAIIDIPSGLNAREAVDWHNGEGLYAGRGKIDSFTTAYYWNWFSMVDRYVTNPTSNNIKIVPPSLAALRALAFTFNNEKPWYAAAGEKRGLVPAALTLQFPKFLTEDVRSSMYGNGNSVNPILLKNGTILIDGERTAQRAESKLTAIHNVILVNTILKNLTVISRKFIFDPLDDFLLTNINLEVTKFLESVKNGRGVEDYNVVIDESNNTADTRNNRSAVVDLYIIPVDSLERLYINAIVYQSGVDLQSIETV